MEVGLGQWEGVQISRHGNRQKAMSKGKEVGAAVDKEELGMASPHREASPRGAGILLQVLLAWSSPES